ncbi:MAG: hypothetical protein ABFD89_03620 [Bryobacteraceae bacterium]
MNELLLLAITGPLCMAIGVFVGAWIHYRGVRQKSPFPETYPRPAQKQEKDKEEKFGFKSLKVKP